MHFQFDMSPFSYPAADPPPAAAGDNHELLRQMLDIQREQLGQLRNLSSAHDGLSRWRAFMTRWGNDFPDLPDNCRQALAVLERTYGKLMAELAENLSQGGAEALDNDFALQEFLDRYGMRLTQLGTILNLVGPLAEAGSRSESA
jgi:phytoene dehydrogenase-like protein